MRTRNRSQLTQEQEQQIIDDQIRAMEMKALKKANKTFPDTYYKILLKKFYIYFRKIIKQNQDEKNQLKSKIQNIIFNSFLPKKLELNDKNDAKNNPVYLFADGKDAQQYNTLEELCIGFNTIYGSKFYQQRSLEKLLTQFQMTFPRYLKDLYFNLSILEY
ncbi:hypothetical protein PPERSA_02136 [Pseudocohnilembus persalinus]|uniref:Uncharacterized protein n=1 Tax=Pseudocohnilembus persalinus TaxID=266149 RepID=A0A0V0Q7I6_PSEPJ|nr:hypothetical protein PPERSA_02136 [Pseudocohnilembus persalinus]|eukprot:KRW98158.1 hypothetical protein PPERSA_02136 [Pseudocohnilembus persalinus]